LWQTDHVEHNQSTLLSTTWQQKFENLFGKLNLHFTVWKTNNLKLAFGKVIVDIQNSPLHFLPKTKKKIFSISFSYVSFETTDMRAHYHSPDYFLQTFL
jgi:hypothetical protein